MRHCIIGAGFAGLPVAKRLKELGEDFDVLDRNTGVGGLWHTGVYRDAHIISSKLTTQYPDLPMPADYPDFPSKEQMQRYFEGYVRHFGLAPHIQLGTTVERVRPAPDHATTHEWLVGLAGGEERRYRTVTIANGHNWSPRRVRHPGHFDGEVLQSSDYWEPGIFTGKRVLVVGYGNTGCDVAVDAFRRGVSSDISMRSGNWFFPKMVMGIPVADLLYRNPLSYAWLDRLLARMTLAVAVGSLERYGVPRPKHRPLDKHPIVNTELLHAIRHGRVRVRPDVERLDGRTVRFVDGSAAEYDTIVYCTGYALDFPMLAREDGLVAWENDLPVLFLQMLAPRRRGLFFGGIGQARTGGGPLYQTQGYLIARAMAFEARDALGVQARLEALPLVRLLASPWIERLTGQKLTAPADMRSHGIGRLRRKLGGLDRLLSLAGAPEVGGERSATPLVLQPLAG